MSAVDRAEAVEIVTLCNDCGVPHMAAGFLGEGLSLDEVRTRVSTVGAVQDIVTGARRVAPHIDCGFAMTMLTIGHSVPAIRTAVFDAIVTEQDKTEISSHVPLERAEDQGRMAARSSMERTLKSMGMTPQAKEGA